MAVKLLVLDMNAELYRDLLSPKFPDVEIHAVHHAPEADKVIAEVDVIVTDAKAPANLVASLRDQGLQVIVAAHPG